MPVVTFHLVDELVDDQQAAELLNAAALLYADVLTSPLDRVRAFIQTYPTSKTWAAGVMVSPGTAGAPFFEFIVLEGRPRDQISRLMQGFTDLLAKLPQVERGQIRGRCIRVNPDDWGIAGQFASELRADEIKARAEQDGAA